MAALVCGWLLMTLSAGCKKPAALPATEVTAPAVMGHPLEHRSLSEYLEITGRIDAVLVVDIRSRISGYLTKIFFRDGQYVKKGDLLYEIDPRPSVAQLEQAEGSLEKLLGEKQFNQVQVERYEKLVGKGAASMQDFDSWKAKRDENTGAMAAARAQVEFARLNVEFCTITSPIDGQISRTQLQIGNLINQDTTTLTTVVSVDPMFVYFNVDEPTLVRVLRTMRGESLKTGADPREVFVDIGLVDDVGRKYPYHCRVDFLDNQLDPQTATITMRGRLENPYDSDPAHPKPPLFRSGMFMRARLPLGQAVERTLVPELALSSNQDRKILWLVDEKGLASTHEVIVGQKIGAWAIVESADAKKPLDRSAAAVVRGLQRCREGKPVIMTLVKADSIGIEPLPQSVPQTSVSPAAADREDLLNQPPARPPGAASGP